MVITMQKEMNISIAVNEKYMRYAYVMLTSLFENHKEVKIHVYVLYNDMTEKSLEMLRQLGANYTQRISTIYIDRNNFPEELPHNKEWTMEIYYRLALADILSEEVERVLYLDVDTIVIASLVDFYHTDFKGKSLCACPDMSAANGLPEGQRILFQNFISKPDFRYFNSGVLLMNLEKIRKNFHLEQFCSMAMKLPLVSPDQDLLNYIFYGDVIYKEEERYNLLAKIAYCNGFGYEWAKKHSVIVHYTGFKPWAYDALHFEVEKFWWEYAKKTPFYLELLEEVVLKEVDTSFMDQMVRRMEVEKKELLNALGKCMGMLKEIEKGSR